MIITHGNTGSANGIVKSERKNLAFCNIYKFSGFKNAKVKEIETVFIFTGMVYGVWIIF